MLQYNFGHWEHWSNPQKVTFDGERKLIIINSSENTVDVRSDIYSAWVNWIVLDQNFKFLPAIRSSGGDPTVNGQFSGLIFFVTNGWRVYFNHSTNFLGSLFSDNFPSPFLTSSDTFIGQSIASNLVTQAAGLGADVPSVIQIRQEIDSNSAKLGTIHTIIQDIPTPSENAIAVWSAPVTSMTDKTTIGGYIGRVLLSIPKFLGLK